MAEEDPAGHRQQYEQAIAQLAQGELEQADTLMRLFERLANRLVSDDPAGLAPLVALIQPLPLSRPEHRHLRHYFQALSLGLGDQYEAALTLFNNLLAEPDLEATVRARALNSRAVFCRYTGRLQEAMEGYQQSLLLWQQLGNRQREGIAWLNLGILAYQLQQLPQAEAHLQQAARCFADSPQWLASAHNELGLVYREQGRWAEALAHFQAAANQRRAEQAQDMLGRALLNMAEMLLFQGEFRPAATSFSQALAAMTTRVYQVDCQLGLGLAYQALGDLPAGRQALEAALTLALEIGRRDILAGVYYRLGQLLRHQGQAEAALAAFVAGAEVIEATRQPLADEGLKIGLLGRWQQLYEGLVLHCLALHRPEQAFQWAEQARARSFAEALASPTTIGKLPQLPAGTTILSYFCTGVLAGDSPMLRAIPAGTPQHDLLLTPAHTILFLLTPAGLTAHFCPLDPNSLFSVSQSQNQERFLKPAILGQLHSALKIPTASDQLIVIPHGPLHGLPFVALENSSGRAILDQAQLSYSPGLALWRGLNVGKGLRPVLAIGYNGPNLQQAEAEAQQIANLSGGLALTGSQPKRDWLAQEAGRWSYLHIACHGQFNPQEPMASWLEMGPGERVPAGEILANWQLQADLVVLSACQSGVSQILRGDEPMGLVRALLRAGAKAVLVAQWPVADWPTFLLMGRFYQLLAEKSPAGALQAAQQWLRNVPAGELGLVYDSGRPFAHPRHWAAFTLIC